jgi:dihydroorotate dehydrogenase
VPDWSYQTLFRPLLFRMPSRLAKSLTLHAMRRVSRLPGGTLLIKTLGHMEPSPLLVSSIAGINVPTPIGLSGAVDPSGVAHQAISQFGFGFIEVGPVTVQPIQSSKPILNDWKQETIVYPSEYENDGLIRIIPTIDRARHKLPQFVHIAPMPGASMEQAIDEIRVLLDTLALTKAAGFYIDMWSSDRSLEQNLYLYEQISDLSKHFYGKNQKPLFFYIPLDLPEAWLEQILHQLELSSWHGFIIGGTQHTNATEVQVGRGGKELALSKVQLLRSRLPADQNTDKPIKVSAAIHEPQDAIDMLQAGASYVLLHSGLIYAGPGLPKRVNEAIIYEKLSGSALPEAPSFWKHWGWMMMLGVGMIVGGMIAWLIAASSVVLPYEEAFLGMTRSELQQLNINLLHFMSHDRITLAGTMISIGILYYHLAKNGLRYGLHWARTALMVSGVVGFPSFFLYLGYGFFDPLHAAAALILFPMFILAMRANPDQPYRQPVNLFNDRKWRRAMWGQLCFVALGFSLCIGGIVIAGVGVTTVFVPQDLTFLGVTREQLELANSRLIPLIAHDRAGFGGALFSNAVMLLIIALWGLQQGQRWLWWTLLAGGSPAFIAGLSVHYSIHYTDFVHLLPAYFAFTLYIAGLILLYPYLMTNSHKSGD